MFPHSAQQPEVKVEGADPASTQRPAESNHNHRLGVAPAAAPRSRIAVFCGTKDGLLDIDVNKVFCLCPECEPQEPSRRYFSLSGFEIHGGRAAAKQPKRSIKIKEDGSTLMHWLETNLPEQQQHHRHRSPMHRHARAEPLPQLPAAASHGELDLLAMAADELPSDSLLSSHGAQQEQQGRGSGPAAAPTTRSRPLSELQAEAPGALPPYAQSAVQQPGRGRWRGPLRAMRGRRRARRGGRAGRGGRGWDAEGSSGEEEEEGQFYSEHDDEEIEALIKQEEMMGEEEGEGGHTVAAGASSSEGAAAAGWGWQQAQQEGATARYFSPSSGRRKRAKKQVPGPLLAETLQQQEAVLLEMARRSEERKAHAQHAQQGQRTPRAAEAGSQGWEGGSSPLAVGAGSAWVPWAAPGPAAGSGAGGGGPFSPALGLAAAAALGRPGAAAGIASEVATPSPVELLQAELESILRRSSRAHLLAGQAAKEEGAFSPEAGPFSSEGHQQQEAAAAAAQPQQRVAARAGLLQSISMVQDEASGQDIGADLVLLWPDASASGIQLLRHIKALAPAHLLRVLSFAVADAEQPASPPAAGQQGQAAPGPSHGGAGLSAMAVPGVLLSLQVRYMGEAATPDLLEVVLHFVDCLSHFA